jgi:hypothetical protein
VRCSHPHSFAIAIEKSAFHLMRRILSFFSRYVMHNTALELVFARFHECTMQYTTGSDRTSHLRHPPCTPLYKCMQRARA